MLFCKIRCSQKRFLYFYSIKGGFVKSFVLFALFALLVSAASFSQPAAPLQIQVGKSPTFAYGYYDFVSHDFRLEFFTIGYDANFDKKEDPDDEKPAWYRLTYSKIITGNTTPEKVRDFPFASLNFPTRIAIDESSGLVFVPNKSPKIAQYNLADGALTDELFAADSNDIGFTITAIHKYDKFLFVSIRYTGILDTVLRNFVNVIDLQTKKIILTIEAPQMVQQTIVANNKLFILGEGNFGEESSQITVYDISDLQNSNVSFINSINVGNTGNHLSIYPPNKLVVTVNGSHTIHIVNTENLQIEKTIQLPTSGYNGPRESQPYGDNTIITTAYDGKLYLHSVDGLLLSTINLENKLEGIFTYVSPNPNIKFDIVVVTSPFKEDYSPNNITYIMVNFTSVDEKNPPSVYLYPTPATSFIKLNIQTPINNLSKFEIIDNVGNIIRTYSFDVLGSEILLPIDGISPGTYFARITSDEKILIIPFSIIR